MTELSVHVSDNVIASIITSLTALITLGLVPILLSTRRQVKEAVYQVKNSHPANLRDDLDERFEAIEKRFDRVEKHLGITQEKEEGDHAQQ